MSLIRPVTLDEVPRLLPGAQQFFDEGYLSGTLNEKHFVSALRGFISNGTGIVLAAIENDEFLGSIGGVVYPDYATGDLVAGELFWYVPQEHRGIIGVRLLKAFEAEAKKHGAARVYMIHLTDTRSEAFKDFYTRSGYRLVENIFCKENL